MAMASVWQTHDTELAGIPSDQNGGVSQSIVQSIRLKVLDGSDKIERDFLVSFQLLQPVLLKLAQNCQAERSQGKEFAIARIRLLYESLVLKSLQCSG